MSANIEDNSYRSLLPDLILQEPDVTPRRAELVIASFNAIAAGTPQFKAQTEFLEPTQHLGNVFYTQLFKIAPEARPLFPADMSKQSAMLIKMISMSVKLLDKPDQLAPMLTRCGERHIRYRTEIAHYAPVGAAMLYALGYVLGDEWNDELKDAWHHVYSVMTHIMVKAQVNKQRALAEAEGNIRGAAPTPVANGE